MSSQIEAFFYCLNDVFNIKMTILSISLNKNDILTTKFSFLLVIMSDLI
jgi:hypothetical protein